MINIVNIIVLLLLLISPCEASIIFQDDFDTCTTNCNSCGTDYWDQWVTSGGCSATYNSTTHYSGEIVSPGRSGSGKLYKVWRHSTSWPDFSGGLVKYLPGSYHDMWFRYYIKIPAAMGLNGGEYCKWWIFNPSGGEGVYLDIMGWEPGAGYLVITNYNIGGTSTVTVLNATDTAAIMDGNWHSLQFHFNDTTQIGTLQLYVDGVLKYNNTSYDWGTTAAWYMLQHFHIGNRGSTTVWQNSWQAFEVDDLVIATTKAETDPDGGSDTTAPTVSSASVSGSTVTINFDETVVTTGYDSGDFNLDCSLSGSNISLSSPSGTGSSRTFTAASAIVYGETCNLDYVGSTNDIEDSAGNDLVAVNDISVTNNTPGSGTTLVNETFEDQSLHGEFYDSFSSAVYGTDQVHGGSYSAKFAWTPLEEEPTGVNTASRWTFATTNTLYTSSYWRFDTSWVGTGWGYHPHLIYITSDVDGDWANLSGGHLRVYIEPTDTGGNIRARIGIGREGSVDVYDTSTNLAKNQWHHIETYHGMNTAGSANGILQMWVNGVSVINLSNVTYRDADHATMSFYELSLGPWMSNSGSGPNVSQTMWIDDLVLMNSIPSGDTTPPTVTISTTDPSSITSDSLSVTGTASDAVGVSSCKWRLTSAPDGSNGTACTGTTSWSCSASGFSRGTNTLYVGCGDAADNWGSDSMIVNYLPVIQGVSGLGVSFR